MISVSFCILQVLCDNIEELQLLQLDQDSEMASTLHDFDCLNYHNLYQNLFMNLLVFEVLFYIVFNRIYVGFNFFDKWDVLFKNLFQIKSISTYGNLVWFDLFHQRITPDSSSKSFDI